MLRPLPPVHSLRSFEGDGTPRSVKQPRAEELLERTDLLADGHRVPIEFQQGCRRAPRHAVQAAIDGAGVMLGRVVLAEGDVAAGRLARPCKIALPLDVSYFMVRSSDEPPRHETQCFREWVFSSLERSRRRPNSKAI